MWHRANAQFWSAALSARRSYRTCIIRSPRALPRWSFRAPATIPARNLPRVASHLIDQGIAYRWGYTFEDLSPAFRTTPLAHFFADMFSERNDRADLESIILQFQALAKPDADNHHSRISRGFEHHFIDAWLADLSETERRNASFFSLNR